MNLRRRGGVEDGGFGVSSFGGDEFGSPMFTPRRTGFDVSQQSQLGGDLFNQKKPVSLLDVRRGGGMGGDTSTLMNAPPPRSPSNGARMLRSQKDPFASSSSNSFNLGSSGGLGGIPSQSLRDSPFMRANPTANATSSRPLTSTPSAPTSSAAQLSTPFETDASPIRPLASTSQTPKPLTEQKEDTPARGLFTPFASPPTLHTESFTHTPSSSAAYAATTATLAPYGGMNSSSKGLGAPSEFGSTVTVYGFAPNQAGKILARFYALGEIVSRDDTAPPSANWVHLTYSTRAFAAMAAGLNEKIIEGCMIGVKRHPVGWTPSGDLQRTPSHLNNLSSTSGGGGGSSIYDRSGRKSTQTPSSSQFIHSNSIYATPQPTNPSSIRKNPCSRIMEYFFGY